MRILITGGLGHIGSYFLRNLSSHLPVTEVLVLDSLLTQRFSSLFHLPEIPRIRFFEKDTRELDILFLSEFGPIDCVIHLSALTDASGTLEKREFLFSNNLDSTKLVVEVCQGLNIPLIFPSTTSVYGSQSSLVDETCSELLPQSPYAECKLEEERVILDAVTHGLRAVILRFGTIHGVSEGMRFHTAVNKFCFQVATGQPISVWKTALDQKRPYLALSDASKAVAHVIKKSLFNGEIYNVLTNNHTVREIISSIKESTAKECEINFVESKIMNQLSYEVSNGKFESTGFSFQGDLQRDVEETMNLLIGIRNA